MIPWLLLLAAASRAELVDRVFDIPAAQWRYWDHPLNEEPALLGCEYLCDTRDSRVRVVLVSHEELNAWLAGHEHDEIAATEPGARGSLRLAVHEPDAYVVIDNRGPKAARVRLRVYLEEPPVRYLSRQRQLAVILISFGMFFAIVTLSARKLLKAMRTR
jgi:hypothetical protein